MLVICCLTSNAYHAGYALSTTRLLKTKRSIILSDFWFEDFFLLVIDVIKPPGTYFNNNIVCRISLIVDLWSSALLSLLLAFFCMLRWIQFESQQSVINFSDKHCMEVGKSNTIPSAKASYIYARFYITSHAWLRLSSFKRRPHLYFFLIVPSLQISCFRKTREKQYAKYD